MKSRARIGLRLLDGITACATAGAAAYMIGRAPSRGTYEWFPRGVDGVPLFLGWVVLVVGGLWYVGRRAGGIGRVGARLPFYVVGALLIALTVAHARPRWGEARMADFQHWPPHLEEGHADHLESLSSRERAAWGARVAMHRLVTMPAGSALESPAPFAIPRSWAFPADVGVVIRVLATGATEVWSRTAEGTMNCVSRPTHSPTRECDPVGAVPDASAFRLPARVAEPGPPPLSPRPATDAGAWPQYRRDARHEASLARAPGSSAAWTTRIDGMIRSSVSASGDVALIGAHGTGVVEALDLVTGRRRWTSRLPNWVHMDIVSDGRVAVAGFGDNLLSFVGRAPSGVAAYDLQTGQHRWTKFDESSVMTSPVIHDSVLVYATGGGVLRKRSLETGALLGQDTLPGGSVMAPPAMQGDTVVFALEHDRVCAVLVSSMATIWCRQVPDVRMMGHAAPAVQDGLVIVSGAASLGALSFREFRRLPWRLQGRLLSSALFPTEYEEQAGQLFMAFRLRDGAPVWRSAVYSDLHTVDGHIAGAATISDTMAVIVLPISNVVVGFRPQTGGVRWSAAAHGARGPALLLDGQVVVSGKDGVTEVRSAKTGALACTMRRKASYDRAGPTSVGGTLLFSEMSGSVEAIPTADLLTCRGIGMTGSPQ